MKINTIIFFLVLINLFGCKEEKFVKYKYKLTEIDYSEIKNAEIKKKLYDTICVKLGETQIKKVCELLNSKNEAELLKIYPKYWIFIKLKNDSIKYFKISDNYFGEKDVYLKTRIVKDLISVYENNSKTECKIETIIK